MIIHSLKYPKKTFMLNGFRVAIVINRARIFLNQPDKSPRTKRRTASRKERQTQLIKATIRSIARHGLSETTMANVANEAGLSQGIINLHFKSKDRLLKETLRHVVDEYRNAWYKSLESSGESAADKLASLVRVDFDKRICQRNKLAVWFAFWGESRSRLTYRKICADHGQEYKQVLTGLCEEIIGGGGYKLQADIVATGLMAMNVGLWLDLLLSPAEMNPGLAEEISLSYLKGIFPGHFSRPGGSDV
jgi:TetR/AcrR family transcriptional repressor of bet genes